MKTTLMMKELKKNRNDYNLNIKVYKCKVLLKLYISF